MNKRHKYALAHPVNNFFTFDGNLKRIVEIEGQKMSSILAVERKDGGGFVWHTSIAPIDEKGTPFRMIGGVTSEQGNAAFVFCKELLSEVGTGSISTIPPTEQNAFHFFRDLSIAERKKMNAAAWN